MNAADDDPGSDAIYDVGTLANVLQLLKLPDGTVKVLVEARRAKIVSFTDAGLPRSEAVCCRAGGRASRSRRWRARSSPTSRTM
jgi:ATP-dependent Lon protease